MSKNEFIQNNIQTQGEIAGFRYISSSLYEEKKSKFYGYIFKVNNKDRVNEIIEGMKKHFKDARHVVYSYVLENEYYYTDNGEPAGTAGKAIYALLEKQKVINTLVVVVRYFGGILLGVGPLSRAYLKAVKIAEENLDIVPYIQKETIEIVCEYSEEPALRNLIEKTRAEIINAEYGDKVKYIICINETDKEYFNRLLNIE